MDNKVSNEESQKKEKKEITVSGRLGDDAKLGESKNEKKPLLTFSIADNSDKENVKWHNVQMWGDNIPNIDLKKGDSVELKGYFKTYETEKGTREEFVATKLSSFSQKEQTSIKGNLGQDPEFKKVNDKDVAAFSVAMKGDNDKTAWQNVQVWNENIEKNKVAELKKGDFVELKGRYGKEYQTKQGETKRDFILEDSRVLKHAEKQAEKPAEKQSEKAVAKQEENKDQKKSRGMKM